MFATITMEDPGGRIAPLHAGLEGAHPQGAVRGFGHAADDAVAERIRAGRIDAPAADHAASRIDDVDAVLGTARQHPAVAQFEHAEQVRITQCARPRRAVAQQPKPGIVRIVALQAAAPGADPEQARRIDLEGAGRVEAQPVLYARVLHEQMRHGQRMRVHEGDAGAVPAQPDFVVGHLRHRIDPRPRQGFGFDMFASDPADQSCRGIDHGRALFARTAPDAALAIFHQRDDLAPRQRRTALRQHRLRGQMSGALAHQSVLGADPHRALASDQQAAHTLGRFRHRAAAAEHHGLEQAAGRIVAHQSGIGGDVDAAVGRHRDRVDVARTDAVPARGVVAEAREGFGGRVEHRHAVDFMAKPDAPFVIHRHREDEVAAERRRIVDAMFEATETIAVEAQQALLRTDPEIAVGALGQRRDHAVRDVVLGADGFEHALAEIERTRTGLDRNRHLPRSDARQQHGDAPPFARPSLPHHACAPWVRPLPCPRS